MTKSRFSQLFAVPCVVLSFTASAMAEEPAARPQSAVSDVALQEDGSLVGRLVDGQGRAIDGAVVALYSKEQTIGRTTSDAEGLYRFTEQKAGVYRLTAGQTEQVFRVWTAQTAPPSAKPYAMMVQSKDVVRGQFSSPGGLSSIVAISTGVAGLIVGGIALDKANDAEDDAAELRVIVNALSP